MLEATPLMLVLALALAGWLTHVIGEEKLRPAFAAARSRYALIAGA